MRSTKLVSAIAAAAALLALATAGALAAPGHKHVGAAGCRVSLFAEPHFVTTGEAAQLFGALSCPTLALDPNQTVTVYEHSAGLGGYRVVATGTTGPGGAFSIPSPPLPTNSVFYVRVAGARSPNRAVKVAPLVTLAGPAPETAAIKTGGHNAVTFTGTVSPSEPVATVLLEREQATSFEEWHGIQKGVVRPDGTFVIVHRFIIPGDANLRVVVAPRNRFQSRGFSNTLSYVISQAQNPRLTLNSSADPVSFGQPVTLSGVLAGGGGQKITLQSHTHGNKFTKLQETTTDGSGAYQFVIGAATATTAYHVTGGGLGSSILYEGVKYLLTASPSASTVQAGQSVTFAGTVTPAVVGKPVYLERENGNGHGFHVVDIGVVVSGGTYSITHFVFGSGKQVYRVHVPGDPTNLAVSSTTFPIEVTPAPFVLLRPQPQPKLPH
jgi:hypothetical protein